MRKETILNLFNKYLKKNEVDYYLDLENTIEANLTLYGYDIEWDSDHWAYGFGNICDIRINGGSLMPTMQLFLENEDEDNLDRLNVIYDEDNLKPCMVYNLEDIDDIQIHIDTPNGVKVVVAYTDPIECVDRMTYGMLEKETNESEVA